MNVDSNGWWFALALVNAGLAEQKNRSRLAWFLLSIILGPFATAWIVIVPPPVKQSRVAPEQWPTVLLFTTAGLLAAVALALGAVAASSASSGLWIACVVAAAGAVLVFVTAWKKQQRKSTAGGTSVGKAVEGAAVLARSTTDSLTRDV